MSDLRSIGPYELVAESRRSGEVVVYRGKESASGQQVLVRCWPVDSELTERALEQAKRASRLHHGRIASVCDYGEEGGVAYIAEELPPGRPLGEVAADASPARRVAYLRQIAEALADAHGQEIVHPGLEPSLAMVANDGEVRLMGFGQAAAAARGGSPELTIETAAYLPPELVRGASAASPSSDVFSFGVLAYELLSGERPFGGNTVSALVYQILYKIPLSLGKVWAACPEPLAALVDRCLDKKAERRFTDAGELLAELQDVCHGTELESAPAEPSPAASPKPDEAVASVAPPGVEDAAELGDMTLPVEGLVAQPFSTQAIPMVSKEEGVVPEDGAVPADGTASADASEAPTGVGSADETDGSDPSQVLADRGQLIAELVAKGDLSQAMARLEETAQQLDSTPSATGVEEQSPGQALAPPENMLSVADQKKRTKKKPPPAAGGLGKWSLAALRARLMSPKQVAEPAEPPAAAGKAPQATEPPAPWRRFLWPGAALAVLALVLLTTLAMRTDRQPAASPPVSTLPVPSEPVEVAAAAPTGGLILQALPWAELVELLDTSGAPLELPEPAYTPLYLRLPAGTYVARLRHPELEEVYECEVQVVPHTVETCETRVTEKSVLEYFKDMGWWS